MRVRRVICLPIALTVAAGIVVPLSASAASPRMSAAPTARAAASATQLGASRRIPSSAHLRPSSMNVPQVASEAVAAPQGIAPPPRNSATLQGLRRIDATTSRQNADQIGSAYGTPAIYATPPSPSIGVGPTKVIEVNNGSVSYYDKPTGVLLRRESLDLFAGFLGAEVASSPQAFYDVRTGRWFITVAFTEYDNTNTFVGSRIVILVSRTNAPASASDFVPHDLFTSPTVLVDEPLLVVTSNKVVVRTNSFDPVTLAPIGTNLFTMNLDGLVPPDPNNPPILIIDNHSLSIAHEGMAAATSFGATAGDADAYFTYWLTSGSAPTTNIGVVRVSGTSSPYTFGETSVAASGAPVPPTDVASTTPASTGTVPFYGGDFQPLSAVARGNDLWTASTASCTPDTDVAVRNCIRLIHTTTGSTSILTSDETYSRLGANLWAPAVTLDSSNQVHLTANVVWTGSSVGVLHDTRASVGSWLATPLIRLSGATYHPLTGVDDVASGSPFLLWSMRSSAVPDPDPANSDVWTGAETVAPYVAATYPSGGNWADTIWRVGTGRTLTASPLTRNLAVVTYGGTSKLSSSVNISGTGVGRNWLVRLDSRVHGVGAYVPATYVYTTSTGLFAYNAAPMLSRDYRVAVQDPITGAAWVYSAYTSVSVKWSVSIKSSATSRRHGRTIYISGRVGPTSRVTAYLQRLYKGKWHTIKSGRTTSTSLYSIGSVLLTGRWYYRVYVPASSYHLATYSAVIRVIGT